MKVPITIFCKSNIDISFRYEDGHYWMIDEYRDIVDAIVTICKANIDAGKSPMTIVYNYNGADKTKAEIIALIEDHIQVEFSNQ